MGPVPKKSPVERAARRAGGHHRRRKSTREDSTLEIMDRLLASRVSISVRGNPKDVPASEAIVLQLMQKAMSGNPRAWRAILKYQDFANSRSAKSTKLQFVESDYTRAVAKGSSGSRDG
jgi:Family of unknown function (DUF5681)